jgi:hypothetical protein
MVPCTGESPPWGCKGESPHGAAQGRGDLGLARLIGLKWLPYPIFLTDFTLEWV